ncbi:hypothetical protein CW362_19910 [Streptomyces populi]|uniref:Uncharacterized protein n=2 Tax=Streptomyces populi TaxID=2058924 RepID=A0A2I0SN45_9ACTN|nr:hypothetical protein CW362_19910 [Streptomyces populi]
MAQEPPPGDHINISFSGAVTGSQIAAGRSVHQRQEHRTAPDTAALEDALAGLRRDIAALTEGEDRTEGNALVDELQSQAAAGRPVHGVGARLRQWIADHAPGLLESVTTVVVPVAVRAAAAAADDAITSMLPPGS